MKEEWLNIILVGSNPMPCYVQAAYLMDKTGWTKKEKEYLFVPTRHLLIYTPETAIYKDQIRMMLEKHFAQCETKQCKIESVCLQAAEGGKGGEVYQYDVERKIKEVLDGKNPKGVILNNTGGTKVMTTYATIAVREWCQRKYRPGAECYLADGKLNCFYFNPGFEEGYSEYKVSNVSLTVKDIVRLHGMEICEEKSEDERIKNLLQDGDFCCWIKGIAARMFSGSDSDTFVQEYLRLKAFLTDMCNSEYALYFKSLTYEGESCEFISPDKARRFEQYTDLLEQYRKKNLWPYFDKNKGCFESEIEEGGSEMADLLNQARVKGLDCWQFFMENWFYYYICCAVRDALRKVIYEVKDKPGEDVKVDIVYRPWIKDNHGKRQYDILFSIGYQLTVISITGRDRAFSVKMDFFEALYQSEKIGGSRSRVMLISRFTNQNSKTYEEEIEAFRRDLDSFSSKQYHQATIFGQKELSDYENLVELLAKDIKK